MQECKAEFTHKHKHAQTHARTHTHMQGACTQCVASKYKVLAGSAVCNKCVAGKFSTLFGAKSDVCQNCPTNSDAPEASDEEVDCSCNPGSSGPEGDLHPFLYMYLCLSVSRCKKREKTLSYVT